MSTENQSDRDWPEGRDYTGMCRECGQRFIGPKWRIQGKACRKCVEERPANAPQQAQEAFAEARSRVAAAPFPGDRNVESVKAKMDARAEVGFRKYGVTTERTDLSLLDWLRHAQMESLDQVIYLEAAIQKEEARIAQEASRPLAELTGLEELWSLTPEDDTLARGLLEGHIAARCPSCGSEFVNGNGSKKCPKCFSHVSIPNDPSPEAFANSLFRATGGELG